eukprot:317427-Alexandrium_andersonii.AAC.1
MAPSLGLQLAPRAGGRSFGCGLTQAWLPPSALALALGLQSCALLLEGVVHRVLGGAPPMR